VSEAAAKTHFSRELEEAEKRENCSPPLPMRKLLCGNFCAETSVRKLLCGNVYAETSTLKLPMRKLLRANFRWRWRGSGRTVSARAWCV
jgi:hypothetical protein